MFPDSGEIISAGNFHGEPLALALDLAAMSLSEIASISERRTFRMLTSSLSELPPFLTTDSGLNNGYMIAQYTAAALVAENKILCHPASVDSIPSSGDQEDHVSMGMTAALKLAGRAAQRADGARHRGAVRGAGHRPAGAARARASGTKAGRDLVRALRADARSATATWRPRSRRRRGPSPTAAFAAVVRARGRRAGAEG